MDDFDFASPEITGSLISLDFGPGGRITQLWCRDVRAPEASHDYQFVLPPIHLSDEFIEDYLPGTILLGARISPEEPWIVSRNIEARHVDTMESTKAVFEYEFGLLPEIRAIGSFYEEIGQLPEMVWNIQFTNRGKHRIEIGELAFPFALNNVRDRIEHHDDELDTWGHRVCLHPFIGGAASYLYAQPERPGTPGLLIYPGDTTSWEFVTHLPASINTPYDWTGIPVVYIASKAAMERERWPENLGEHTSFFLSPGETRSVQLRMAPCDRGSLDAVATTLAVCRRPAFVLSSSAVAPIGGSIHVNMMGATPINIEAPNGAIVESDAFEDGGYCHLKSKREGLHRVWVEDTMGRSSYLDLLYTPPIEALIKRRAAFIAKHQVCKEPESNLRHAILPWDRVSKSIAMDQRIYETVFGVESSLSDALFLACKNRVYPDVRQIAVLERYATEFLESSVINPGTSAVGSVFVDEHAVAIYTTNIQSYLLAIGFYAEMGQIAETHGETGRPPEAWLTRAGEIACALFQRGLSRLGPSGSWIGLDWVHDLQERLVQKGDVKVAHELGTAISNVLPLLQSWARDASPRTASAINAFVGKVIGAGSEASLRGLVESKSLAPTWWWFGSSKVTWDPHEEPISHALDDRGELCHSPQSVADSIRVLELFERDYSVLPDAWVRMAFGGLIGVWSLVSPEGDGAMTFCPDPASRHAGMHRYSGRLGLSLALYLKHISSMVLPSQTQGIQALACEFETAPLWFKVRPWDGVGRRVALRQIDFELETSSGVIREVRLDSRKRKLEVSIENGLKRSAQAYLTIQGMWGRRLTTHDSATEVTDGKAVLQVTLKPMAISKVEVEVAT